MQTQDSSHSFILIILRIARERFCKKVHGYKLLFLIYHGKNNDFCVMEMQTLHIFSHPGFDTWAKQFYDKYNLVDIITVGDSRYSKRNLRGYSIRICRFCGLSYPDTKFSNLSHLLPQMIGNTNLYSDFECDKCNAKFSGFENDLAGFLGISRSITGLSDEKQAPGFAGRRIGAKSRSYIGSNILIIAPEDVKKEGDKTTISYIKNAFTPSNVYKALFKCALSLLSDNEVNTNYRLALRYLAGKYAINNGAVITGYQLSFQTNFSLRVYIFRKKSNEDRIPTHVMCFQFQNHIISFPLPLHRADLCNASESEILFPPPYFTNEKDMITSMPVHFLRDMSSSVKIDDEEENFFFQLEPESLKDLCRYDPNTGKYEKVDYGSTTTKYIIVFKDGATVDPDTLIPFIKEQMEGK